MTPHHRLLTTITSLPTASGREEKVIAFVRRWAQRAGVSVRADAAGNLLLFKGKPRVLLTAHMDHPALVWDAMRHELELRGGVLPTYVINAQVRSGSRRGQIVEQTTTGWRVRWRGGDGPRGGAVVTWDLPPARRVGHRLHAPACDDLAGVAAALLALKAADRGGVLLTRAEEVGFVGAIAACESGLIPREALLVNIECSKAQPEAPMGKGPIVRVGDRTCTFDPDLTLALTQAAQQLAQSDAAFAFQRRLMPGGTCEATAFLAHGYRAGAVCLALGNYHNMDERRGRIGPETIDLRDFDRLVTLLTALLREFPAGSMALLRARLALRCEQHRSLLG